MKAWENLRELTVQKTFQFAGMFVNSKCIHCDMEVNFKCTDFGLAARFCEECMLRTHTTINIFHHVEILKVIARGEC